MTEPILLTAKEAARYLGLSKSFFEEKVRPYIACVDMRGPGSGKPMPRWERVELDRFVQSRKQEQRKAS